MNNLRLDTLASKQYHACDHKPHIAGPIAAYKRASLGLSRRAGANAHQTQKPRAGCPARTPADATAANAAPAGRRDSRNGPPAGLPAGSCPSTNKQPKKTLAAKTWRPHQDATRTLFKLRENSEDPWP